MICFYMVLFVEIVWDVSGVIQHRSATWTIKNGELNWLQGILFIQIIPILWVLGIRTLFALFGLSQIKQEMKTGHLLWLYTNGNFKQLARTELFNLSQVSWAYLVWSELAFLISIFWGSTAFYDFLNWLLNIHKQGKQNLHTFQSFVCVDGLWFLIVCLWQVFNSTKQQLQFFSRTCFTTRLTVVKFKKVFSLSYTLLSLKQMQYSKSIICLLNVKKKTTQLGLIKAIYSWGYKWSVI